MPFELVYTSVAKPENMPDADLQRILISSRRHNLTHGISGVLLFDRGGFVQLLEGSRDAVQSVYHDRIVKDTRHGGIYLSWEADIAARSFADWSMGFARQSDLPQSPSPEWDGFLKDGIKSLDLSGPGSSGRRLLLAIYGAIRSAPFRRFV